MDTKRGPGRPKGRYTHRYQVLLEPEIAAWAAGQVGGLSATIRRLLRQASGIVKGGEPDAEQEPPQGKGG